MQSENQVLTLGGCAASGPKNDDDRCAPRPRGIQCYNCWLLGHTSNICPGRKRRNLNGIRRAKATPPSGRQLRPLVTGMTYRRRMVLFPLKTDTESRLTNFKFVRLR